jgi:NAD(P)-dependent dehydrogenase (short-subunit alcohol dehydrogenase family)
MDRTRTWFITGAGRGLGRAFTEAALAAGDRVAATARHRESLRDLADEHPAALRVITLDVRDRQAVFGAVEKALACFGRLDVVVNNAGYGLVGAAEEVTEAEARRHLDTNLFGPLWVCQAVLPHLRRQGDGHIVQISSTGGVGTMPLFGLYNAGKWALEGLSEALAGELAGSGVRVTIAELGAFATDWAGSSMRFARPVPGYDEVRTSLFGTSTVPWELPENGDSPPDGADPREAASALVDFVKRGDDRLRLLVGDDAPSQVAIALDRRREDYGRDPRFRAIAAERRPQMHTEPERERTWEGSSS